MTAYLYEFTFLNVDGAPLWTTREVEKPDTDPYRALMGYPAERDQVECLIDSPVQDDLRARFAVRITRTVIPDW